MNTKHHRFGPIIFTRTSFGRHVQYGTGFDGRVQWQIDLTREPRHRPLSERRGNGHSKTREVRIGKHHLSLWINQSEQVPGLYEWRSCPCGASILHLADGNPLRCTFCGSVAPGRPFLGRGNDGLTDDVRAEYARLYLAGPGRKRLPAQERLDIQAWLAKKRGA